MFRVTLKLRRYPKLGCFQFRASFAAREVHMLEKYWESDFCIILFAIKMTRSQYVRGRTCNLLSPLGFPGFALSSSNCFYGLKLQVVTPLSIKPPAFKFSPLLWQQTDCFSKWYVSPVILNWNSVAIVWIQHFTPPLTFYLSCCSGLKDKQVKPWEPVLLPLPPHPTFRCQGYKYFV